MDFITTCKQTMTLILPRENKKQLFWTFFNCPPPFISKHVLERTQAVRCLQCTSNYSSSCQTTSTILHFHKSSVHLLLLCCPSGALSWINAPLVQNFETQKVLSRGLSILSHRRGTTRRLHRGGPVPWVNINGLFRAHKNATFCSF